MSQSAPDAIRAIAFAARETIRTKIREVVKLAQPRATVHLDNLAASGPNTDSWLGGINQVLKIENMRWFGRETRAHLEVIPTVLAFETMLRVYGVADVGPAAIPALARQLPAAYARLILTRHPENLTVILAGEGAARTAHVHTPQGWQSMCPQDAAAAQVRAFIAFAIPFVDRDTTGSKLLAPVARYLEAHADEIAAEEAASLALLTRYAAEAERYYCATTGRTLAEPRRLLAKGPPDRWTDDEISGLLESL